MIGNVWEWTEHCFHDNYYGAPTNGAPWLAENGGDCTKREGRGGAADNASQYLGSANHDVGIPGVRDNRYGFRVARTLLAP